MSRIILASASPRRKELLEQAGISFEIFKSTCEEIITESDPAAVVKELSGQKAADVAQKVDGDDMMIIAADTIVACDGRILGKPKSEADALAMLTLLAGRSHQVYTGVTMLALVNGQKKARQLACCTEVEMFPATEKQLLDYIATGEPMDKAGAYGIQGRACIFVREIRGDYNNVVGLPVSAVWQYLEGNTEGWTDASL